MRRERKPRAPRAPRARTIARQAWAEQVAALDLNASVIPGERPETGRRLADPEGRGELSAVFFRDLKPRLLKLIGMADFAVGCVAWLTEASILEALGQLRGAALVVQKEDFLRPSAEPDDEWRFRLRSQYERITPLERAWFPYLLADMKPVAPLEPYAHKLGVRCMGSFNSGRLSAFPRMHHKFLVFFRYETTANASPMFSPPPDGERRAIPICVWTGSFNLTDNAQRSLENAVVIYEPDVVDAFLAEFVQLAALSEPLDWTDNWSAPDWRLP